MLIAILGRGIQRIQSKWCLTEDLEICSPTGAHLVERIQVDDKNPHCVVGGGELNLLAGVELQRKMKSGASVWVCGYTNRAPYLVEQNAPSESEIMSEILKQTLEKEELPLPKIEVWGPDRALEGRSNTQQELKNIFGLALAQGINEVMVITITVHLPRTISFAKDHLTQESNFQCLQVNFLASEQVLVEINPQLYARRVLDLYSSQAFLRSSFYEGRGVNAFLNGTY